MFPLKKQIQIASDNAKGIAARLSGIEVPKMEDNEATFAELDERLAKTIHFLESLTPEQFTDAATRTVKLPYFPGMHLTGEGYLTAYAIPNFFFHVTTSYDILRHLGVPLQKVDYLGKVPFIKD